MKPLLSKTTKPFLIYVLIILIISIPVYFIVVDTIWKNELDEHNKTIAQKTAFEFNHLKLSDEELKKSIMLWEKIQPETNIQEVLADPLKKDVYSTIEKPKLFSSEPEIERYRSLKTVVYINSKPYIFTVETNIEESQETIAAITVITTFFFIMIVLGLLILNKNLSETVWKPFRITLEKLKNFNLNSQNPIEFEQTDTREFEELHQSLRKLIDHNILAYQTQKEFTENASHELQTPLAILKNKIDLLLQNKDLTEKQYHIVEEMNKTLTRSSRINKNLLLLAKIDNNQFDTHEKIQIDTLIRQSLALLEEHFQQKNIRLTSNVNPRINVCGDGGLTEVLINNLLINAIRYTDFDGSVSVKLTHSSLEITNSGSEKLNADFLFKRFSRLSTENKGSGLGLAIIKQICRFQSWNVDYKFENRSHVFTVLF
ncbi:HAMP domain-containing histidine kinase [Chryseobacterium chendengshani]|uniref:sensor histidine kinase n=1 Tax=Chryseobacterium sp. LJ668 TaxID=2864040 RepID=UPI001C6874C0|nr:HAMP domain-containing sensor histidine kinase [Chryseobacterium sp. LJ668]MBW8523982.1 HAMP domain-containing histidine kinase [Chryseobacterium sp. LJ668]QYK16920.1 HAMP domain-containing histidine kinase [Chryseobacterium sp. LJ668]